MTKQEMIDEIYKVVGTKIYDYSYGEILMIGDVLDWIENKKQEQQNEIDKRNYLYKYESVLFLWRTKRKPIENQSIECIEYIYNLIK